MEGQITDIDRFSTHDGPGIRTAVFFQGCPLRCRWCHSPETQPTKAVLVYRSMKCIGCGTCIDSCPQGAIVRQCEADEDGYSKIRIERELCQNCFFCVPVCPGKALGSSSKIVRLEEIEHILKQDKPFYDNSGGGVTLSGGEILKQPKFALAILTLCRGMNIHTAVETSGYGKGKDLLEIGKVADLIYFDVKMLDGELHHRFVGADNRLILENLKLLCENEEKIGTLIVRVPCIPGINDSQEQIQETARFVKALGVSWLELLPYNEAASAKYTWLFQEYQLKELHTRSKEYYQQLEETVARFGLMPYTGTDRDG